MSRRQYFTTPSPNLLFSHPFRLPLLCSLSRGSCDREDLFQAELSTAIHSHAWTSFQAALAAAHRKKKLVWARLREPEHMDTNVGFSFRKQSDNTSIWLCFICSGIWCFWILDSSYAFSFTLSFVYLICSLQISTSSSSFLPLFPGDKVLLCCSDYPESHYMAPGWHLKCTSVFLSHFPKFRDNDVKCSAFLFCTNVASFVCLILSPTLHAWPIGKQSAFCLLTLYLAFLPQTATTSRSLFFLTF